MLIPDSLIDPLKGLQYHLGRSQDAYGSLGELLRGVETIEGRYTAHLKDTIDTSLINVRKVSRPPRSLGLVQELRRVGVVPRCSEAA